jgi:hypothetical protein
LSITWAESAAKHRIPRDEALYAIAHAELFIESFGQPRIGDQSPSLFIGPSRYGTLEVLAVITPPREIWVFHVMPLRETTAEAAGYEG